jgi:hypothetical protein
MLMKQVGYNSLIYGSFNTPKKGEKMVLLVAPCFDLGVDFKVLFSNITCFESHGPKCRYIILGTMVL